MADNSEQLDRIERGVDELLRWKNGDNDQPGVNVRLDRLEQHWLDEQAWKAKLSAWLMAIFCGGGITAAVAIWAAMKAK